MKPIYWKGLRLFFGALGVVALTACGTSTENGHEDHKQHQQQDSEVEAAPEVEMTFTPKTIQAGEETIIRAVITQNGETVEDAHEVSFDIWPKGASQEEREKVKTKLADGGYQGTYTFPQAGDYQVMVHVTARGSHKMETVDVSVQP